MSALKDILNWSKTSPKTVPAPAELKADIENLENWVSGMRKRR
jgi:hypothetical protein